MMYRDICYDICNIHESVLDIFTLPNNSGKRLVVLLHGGHGHSGDKSTWTKLAQGLASQGMVVATINYPLGNINHKEQLKAIQLALAWLNKETNATFYGYSTHATCIVGHEHSATLLAHLLLSNQHIKAQALVLLQASYTLEWGDSPSPLNSLPQKWIVPYILLMDEDTTNAETFSNHLQDHGIDCNVQRHSFHHHHGSTFTSSLVSTLCAYFKSLEVVMYEPIAKIPLKSTSSASNASIGSNITLVDGQFNLTMPVKKVSVPVLSPMLTMRETLPRTNSVKTFLSKLKSKEIQ
jgi:hypothetical protein